MQVKGDKSRAKKASEKDKNEILGFEALAAMQKVLAEKNKELVQMKERLDKHMKKPKVKSKSSSGIKDIPKKRIISKTSSGNKNIPKKSNISKPSVASKDISKNSIISKKSAGEKTLSQRKPTRKTQK